MNAATLSRIYGTGSPWLDKHCCRSATWLANSKSYNSKYVCNKFSQTYQIHSYTFCLFVERVYCVLVWLPWMSSAYPHKRPSDWLISGIFGTSNKSNQFNSGFVNIYISWLWEEKQKISNELLEYNIEFKLLYNLFGTIYHFPTMAMENVILIHRDWQCLFDSHRHPTKYTQTHRYIIGSAVCLAYAAYHHRHVERNRGPNVNRQLVTDYSNAWLIILILTTA